MENGRKTGNKGWEITGKVVLGIRKFGGKMVLGVGNLVEKWFLGGGKLG